MQEVRGTMLNVSRGIRIGIAVAGLAVLASCSRLEDSHGYIPDQALLSQVQLGVDTKDTTARLLGRPGTAGIIDDRGWYYVKSDYERFLWRAPVEVDRQVVAVSFSEAGVVENVERFGLEDGQVVALSRRVTTSNTRGIGFLRQLFSNIGGLDAGSFLDEG
ncbi:MAG: outer membrane protein assembly factor BamE [Silicimonas sp.]|nr:outer membrane protein assembly factor BamE [Silicimonas sp.]